MLTNVNHVVFATRTVKTYFTDGNHTMPNSQQQTQTRRCQLLPPVVNYTVFATRTVETYITHMNPFMPNPTNRQNHDSLIRISSQSLCAHMDAVSYTHLTLPTSVYV